MPKQKLEKRAYNNRIFYEPLNNKIMETDTDVKSRPAKPRDHRTEGKVATALENQTAKLPSDAYLWASIGAMIASLTLKILKQDKTALFVGQWAPSFLILGLYNKLVKQIGHDRHD